MTIRMLTPLQVAALVALTALFSQQADAQSTYYFRHPDIQNPPSPGEPAPNGDWNLDSDGNPNLSGGTYWWDPDLENNFIPDADFGEGEFAYIENGGVAYVQTNGGFNPGEIAIGTVEGSSGGVEIRSGGVMRSEIGGSATTGTIRVGGTQGVGTLTVLPGGEMSAETALVSGNNAANTITVGAATGAGTAILSSASASLNGFTDVYANADFQVAGPLGFGSGGNSSYRVQVTGNGASGKIVAGGAATLNGELTLDFGGYSPQLGHKWTVLEANSFTGNFSSVVSTASLPFNQQFVATKSSGAQSATAFNIGVEEVLVLDVDRDTGEVTITHPGASTIAFDGYYVGSNGGLLSDNPADWTSLTESGQYGADWFEQAQRTDNVGEVKVGADATFSSDVPLGAIYNPLAGEFGVDVDDLEFVIRRSSDGAELTGVVQYSGATANTLVLQVDPTGSGDAYLRNTSNTTVEIDKYEIRSEMGSLDATGLTGIDDSGTDWVPGLNNGDHQITEFNQSFANPSQTLAPGAAINVGAVFDGGDQDLDFSFLLFGEAIDTEGIVVYETFTPPEGLPGDYNEDNVVDAADYTVWRDAAGASTPLPNDDGLGVPIGAAHYDLWRTNYGAALGLGSTAQAQATPEPATAFLATLALAAACLRRRSSRCTTR